jgi:hypothetical protein
MDDLSWKNVVYREKLIGLNSWQAYRRFYRKLLRGTNNSQLGYVRTYVEYYHVLPLYYLKT